MTRIHTPPANWHWISLTGPDSQDFLHRLTTCDVRNMKPGQGAQGCFLTAQGKMRAYFTLWHYGPSEYAFEFDGGESDQWKASLLATIEQFTFAERMTLIEVTPLSCRWLFSEAKEFEPAHLAAREAGTTLAIDAKVRLCHHGSRDFGRPWITAWGLAEDLENWLASSLFHDTHDRASLRTNIIDTETLEKWRIQALRPRVGVEIDDTTMPLEIGLIDAIAQGKGCYPGQEVIERIISMGAPSRRLAKIQGTLAPSAPPAPGNTIVNLATPPAEIGKITSVTREGNEFIALGLIRKIHAKEGMSIKIQSATQAGETGETEARITQLAPYAP